MTAADAMCHLDAVARSVPEPVLPPDALNSQISGILRATRPFLDTDHDWILQNIELFQQQLSGYDALLDRIDEVRLEIQRRREAVHRSMAAYSSTLAPIRRLPSEIFRAVFREVQISPRSNTEDLDSESESESEPESEDYQVLDFLRGPWKLSHVCGAWRDIVLSYPQLWSHIVLRSPMKMLDHTIPALQAMILRSAQHPLDIMFEHEDSDDEDAAVQAFSVILEESYRWRTMDLQIPMTLLERLKAVRGKIPCLESLTMKTFHLAPSRREELPEDVRSVFIDAPRLQKVALHHTYGLGDFMFPIHITHLASFMDKVSNLEAYQSLVECHLRLAKESDPDFFPPHSIHLPNVRRLFVSSPHPLAYLRLPSLDDLNISSGPNMSGAHAIVLMMNEFVHRSRCTLTRLTIHNPILTRQIFIKDCLLLMNSLESLEIGPLWNVEAKIIFDALASTEFLPKLQHLSLRLAFTQDFLWEPFTAMISSRSQYLRSIRISCGSAFDVETINKHLAPLWPPSLPMVVAIDTAIFCFGNFESR